MGYMHIDNLYKNQDVMLFRDCYALEKIHGTSTHVGWHDGKVSLFSGGEKHDNFAAIFDIESLAEKFRELGHDSVTVFGEGYGGRCQGMSATYGKKLSFIGFEVMINEVWLRVPDAADVCGKLGLEFVHYVHIQCDLEHIDAERDAPSEQAFRNGCADRNDPATFKIREGVVLRPLIQATVIGGGRIVAKHKRAEFSERKTIPNVDPSKRELMDKADAIAIEFVTDMRLAHVLDKLGNPREFEDIPNVVTAMVEDVCREAAGEIVDNKAVRKAISSRTVKLYKTLITTVLRQAGQVL